MPDLYPVDFRTLVLRLDREMAAGGPIFAMPKREWWTPEPGFDLSMQHLAGRAATPVGPASGPHTQMAQNLVLSWLGGGRFMELKTIQILDELEIPRPCIHIPNIGYNVEWSQELLVHESAREYAAGWFLVHMLASDKGPGLWSGGAADTIFDLSLGYDLAGIQGEKVTGFIRTMKNAGDLLAQLRDEIRADLPQWADLEVPDEIGCSTTLSTFHGCPADEIESIAAYTIEEHKLHTVIKLNPTLLGFETVRKLMDDMGYGYVKLHEEAFKADLNWAQMSDMLPRLEAKAAKAGVGLGVKFSNTLVCESPETPFEASKTGGEMYLSGPPLHVLAMTLADKFRQETNGRLPISFSAGVDGQNFMHAVAAGLQPITTCSDLLKGTGYGRLHKYLRNLEREMKKLEVADVPSYIAARGEGEDPAGAFLKDHAEATRGNDRYFHKSNERVPKKIGSELEMLDCINCDKCIRLCPNMANISVTIEQGEWNPGRISWDGSEVTKSDGEALVVKQDYQIGNVVDLCNLCGQCDPWCPEDGGPYLAKPHLFLTRRAWDDQQTLDGFLLEESGAVLRWRHEGAEYTWRGGKGDAGTFSADGGSLELDGDEVKSAAGHGDVDLRLARLMRMYLAGFVADDRQLFTDGR